MKKRVTIAIFALLLAALFSLTMRPMPIEQRLMNIQVQDKLQDFPNIAEQPITLQAVLLDMADDPLLRIKAQAAFMRYPSIAPNIFLLYGQELEFKDILRRYGENILPPIHHFQAEPIHTIELMHQAGLRYQAFKNLVNRTDTPDTNTPPSTERYPTLSATQRGWYAVNFIYAEGHDFLGQFLVDEQGHTQWLVSERMLEGINQFFASGVRNLEKKHRAGDTITAADVGWASLDIVIWSGAVKALQVGRGTAVTTKNMSRASRSATFTTRLATSGRLVLNSARYAKWPTIIAAGYLVVKHPSVINDVLAELANALGYPVLLIQLLGWFLLLLPLLYLSRWLLWVVSPLLMGLLRSTQWLIIKVSGRKEPYF